MNPGVAQRISEITERTVPTEDREIRFEGIALLVRKGVFDPSRARSTPRLARALELFPPSINDRVLEIGTGSGALSIFIHRLTGAVTTATDISPIAVSCANENFRRHGIPAHAIVSDLFGSLMGTYNYVVFNPPTAHFSVSADSPSSNPAVWDVTCTLKQRFMRDVRQFLDATRGPVRILLMYSIFADYDSLEGMDCSGFEREKLLIERDDAVEAGVLSLTRSP